MISLTFWLIGVATVILQTSLLQGMPVWFSRPDFLFVLLIFTAYRFAWVPGIIIVFSLSWLMDVVSGIFLGFYPLICLLLFTTVKSISYRNPVKESSYQIPLLGAAWLCGQFLQHFIYSFWLDQLMPDWQWGQYLLDVILLMIVAIPLFALYNVFFQFLTKWRQQKKTSRRTVRRTGRAARSIQ